MPLREVVITGAPVADRDEQPPDALVDQLRAPGRVAAWAAARRARSEGRGSGPAVGALDQPLPGARGAIAAVGRRS